MKDLSSRYLFRVVLMVIVTVILGSISWVFFQNKTTFFTTQTVSDISSKILHWGANRQLVHMIYRNFTDAPTNIDTTRFVSHTNCTESKFTFRPPSSNKYAFKDKAVLERCGVYNETSHPAYVIPQQTELNPEVMTKCGPVTGKLLSKSLVVRKSFDDNLVPNYVHYVYFGKWKFKFLNYISFKSVEKFIQPSFIFIHGTFTLEGEWWNRMRDEVPNIFWVPREKPVFVNHAKLRYVEHSSDVLRTQIILDNGGIYLDSDVIVLKPFSPLRQYNCTMGREVPYAINNGIIIARQQSPFLCVLFEGYRDYDPNDGGVWAKYSVMAAHKLSQILPAHIHVEAKSLVKPSWAEPQLLFSEKYDLSENFAVHVWTKAGHKVPQNPKEIRKLQTTLGQAMRTVYDNK